MQNTGFIFSCTNYSESIVIFKSFDLMVLMKLHVLDLPESEKSTFEIVCACVGVCVWNSIYGLYTKIVDIYQNLDPVRQQEVLQSVYVCVC